MTRLPRLLVVGNSLMANAMRQFILEDAGYSVVTAIGVSAGLKAATDSSFDLAVVDGLLPREDVTQLLIALREQSVRTLLIALPGAAQGIESLADAHIRVQDGLMLIQFVRSLLQSPAPARKDVAVPLGIGKETVQVGEHIAWFYSTDAHFENSVRFLEAGFERSDVGIVYGDNRDYERVARILNAHGFDDRKLTQEGRLTQVDAASMVALGDAWGTKVKEMISSFPSVVRLFGAGTLRLPWPSDESFFAYEARADAALGSTRSVTICLYDLKQVSGNLLLHGGLGCHKTVVTPAGIVRKHPFFEEHA